MDNLEIRSEEKPCKISSFNGIDVYLLKTGKFKTNSINIFFIDNLSRENVTKNALIPAVMRRGSSGYPTFRDISIRLEELYGASFDCGVFKLGEYHVVQFYTEFLSGKFVETGRKQFEDASGLLFNIVLEPLMKNGSFYEEYINIEKENLKNLINSRVNDKVKYSLDRCIEEMCKDEPFSLNEYGVLDEIDGITSGELTAHYRKMLSTFPVKVYIAGDIDEDCAKTVVEKLRLIKRDKINEIMKQKIEKEVIAVNEVNEKMNVTQGKLSLGFRTNIPGDSNDYYALMVYNGILGGGTHSKLFANVREKAGLAYYVFSTLEKYKGLMLISSGIEITNKEKAKKIILEQLDDIKKGKITDMEMDSTKKNIVTGLRSMADSQIGIVNFYLGQDLSGTNETFESIIEKVKKVRKEDVVSVASRVVLDTVYFLTSGEGA